MRITNSTVTVFNGKVQTEESFEMTYGDYPELVAIITANMKATRGAKVTPMTNGAVKVEKSGLVTITTLVPLND